MIFGFRIYEEILIFENKVLCGNLIPWTPSYGLKARATSEKHGSHDSRRASQ